ncbi:MAG: preprotein translocase subunit YajC [Elusimicrobiales bacterium]|nr:preprotein translocase subunit YajC [Elusimicrobiales bacterium]HOJ87071.1 preprotein translocase subunit YajC [Elusimicrobiales bacterium]HOL62725.1 preprotein translocase subunit YajC [Elusimicrobiales bacterium]HPO95278.1 preprotein translocase subunit YajC [Elusimicrobiales bacterium]
MNAAQPSAIMQILPFILMIAIFYFLLIRPQQKQMKERQKMLDSLKVGDKVITVGGIIGTITSIKDNEIELEISKNVKVTALKTAVTSVNINQ